MSDEDPIPEETTLTLHLNATVQVNGQDYIKPGVSVSQKFGGSNYPSDEQLIDAFEWMLEKAITPVMEEMVALSNQKVTENRRRGYPSQ